MAGSTAGIAIFLTAGLMLPSGLLAAASQQNPPATDQQPHDTTGAPHKQSVKIVFKPPKVIMRSTEPGQAQRLGTAAGDISSKLSDAAADEPEVAASEVQSMGTVTVQGHKLKPVCILSFLKVALHTEYSDNPMQSGDTVCRYVHLLSSRARTYLRCETNAEMTARYRANTRRGSAQKERTIKLEMHLPIVDPGKLMAAMAALPPDTSRTCSS